MTHKSIRYNKNYIKKLKNSIDNVNIRKKANNKFILLLKIYRNNILNNILLDLITIIFKKFLFSIILYIYNTGFSSIS